MRPGFVLAALALGVMIVAAPVADAKSSSKSSKLTAMLIASSDAPGAKGKATFQTSASGKSSRTPSSRRHGSDDGGNGGSCSGAPCSTASTRQELEVEVEHVRRLVGTTLTVFVDGANVGNLTIGTLGSGELKLRSQAGQTVPAVQVGSQVEVRKGDGTLVVSGVFR